MKTLLQFIHRNPWIYVVLAFLLLIAAWTTAYILAGRVNTTEVPLTPPASHAQ
jgi:ABC-type arginine/histidine transport system permease subunit